MRNGLKTHAVLAGMSFFVWGLAGESHVQPSNRESDAQDATGQDDAACRFDKAPWPDPPDGGGSGGRSGGGGGGGRQQDGPPVKDAPPRPPPPPPPPPPGPSQPAPPARPPSSPRSTAG